VVTLVMPAYNEADVIEASVREWHEEVVDRLPGSEILVVDDCSADLTPLILQRLSRELAGVRFVRAERNGGHGNALRLGFQHAAQEYVFQTDSDRQHLPSDFWNLWNKRAFYDFVFGVRTSRADGRFRVFITRTMRLVNFILWGVWISDANCPFKLMRRDALLAVLEKVPRGSFIPMVMVSILSRRMGFNTAEVPVAHLARKAGSQSLKGVLRWLHVCALCFRQLLNLRLSLR
jgi:dolichol-phosphate mannosyltransferase